MSLALTSPASSAETSHTRYIVARSVSTVLLHIVVLADLSCSSDVLADMRVNVSEEGSEQVLWYKVGPRPSAYRVPQTH